MARLLFRQEHRPREALELRAARDAAGGQAARTRAAPPRSPPAAPIPAWCPGSSSRRCSTSPRDTNTPFNEPKSREGWGQLAHKLGVKGIHIAERDTQRSKKPKPMNMFVNTWSVEGFVSEGMQPAELGWGTHEKWMPDNGRTHTTAAAPRSICCSPAPTPACARGARRRARNTASSSPTTSRSRSPTISRCATASKVIYRPTCHYAYHPANDAVLSLHEMFGATGKMQPKLAHPGRKRDRGRHRRTRRAALWPWKNAYWYGSQLSIEETRRIAPYQNATGMQVIVRGARRHGVGAGKSRTPASSRPTRWISAAASKSSGRISAR